MGLDPHSTHISSAAFHDIVIMGWPCCFYCCFKCVAIATSWYTSVINDVRIFFWQIFLLGCWDWGSVPMIPSDLSWREVCPSSGNSMCIHQLHVASFPGLPRFLFFGYSTRKRKSPKNGEGLGTPITWMTSGGCEVDVGGEGSTFK